MFTCPAGNFPTSFAQREEENRTSVCPRPASPALLFFTEHINSFFSPSTSAVFFRKRKSENANSFFPKHQFTTLQHLRHLIHSQRGIHLQRRCPFASRSKVQRVTEAGSIRNKGPMHMCAVHSQHGARSQSCRGDICSQRGIHQCTDGVSAVRRDLFAEALSFQRTASADIAKLEGAPQHLLNPSGEDRMFEEFYAAHPAPRSQN